MSTLAKSNLFPEKLATEFFSLVKGKSSLAKLANAEPLPFVGKDIFTFNFSNKLSIVGESANKPAGDAAVTAVKMVPVKVEYQMRVSDEFMYASEESQLNTLSQFADGFSKVLAEGFDVMAMHGLNPADSTASSIIGTNHFDGKVTTNVVTYAAATADDNINDAIEAVESGGYTANGIAMSPAMRGAIAAISTGASKTYPEFNFGAIPASLGQMNLDVNRSVAVHATSAKTDHAIIGDFSAFKWGIAKEIPMKVIEYGDPDGQGDLQRKNEVVIRAEAYIGWAIMDAAAFALVKTST